MLGIKVIINLNQVKEYGIIFYYFYRQPRHGINPATWMCLHQGMTWISNFIYRSYVSPSNEGRYIVLSLIFSSASASSTSTLLLPLLLSEACPDHNFFVFPDISIIFGMWVHDHKTVCHIPEWLCGPWPLTSRSNNCFLNRIFLCHNIFVFQDRSMIFGMWVHDHKAMCRVP